MENVNPSNPPPAPGDRVPDLLLPNAEGTVVSLYDKSRGHLAAVVFAADVRETATAIGAALAAEDVPEMDVFVITDSGGGAWPVHNEDAIHHLYDPQGRALGVFGFRWGDLDGQTRLYLLDQNQRLLEQFFAFGNGAIAACIDYVKSLSPEVEVSRPSRIAPVLMIPRVFEPQFCRYLIDAFQTRGHEESGVYSLTEGELRHTVDHRMKKRFDHYVRDDDLTAAISGRIARRVLPEIEKAFWYRVTKLEEFKIACYRASEKGYFRAHRDNFSPQTLHRRFAMTLNLNSDAYEGGELRFPEYGPHLYKPATGEAVIFSCSMLHEALDVTEGERYVLLAFLYGEDGARQKSEMARRMKQMGK